MRKPHIGISTGNSSILEQYCYAVEMVGGIPRMLSGTENIPAIVEQMDGWVIRGGLDIPPSEYGEALHPEVSLVAPERYQFEKQLWNAYFPTKKPILGICYGCQFINIQHGGSLIQHISETTIIHRGPEGQVQPHQVNIEPCSVLAISSGTTVTTQHSSHHQAIKRLGMGLRIVAYAPDGITEAVETTEKGRWLLGVQWHPERLPETEATQNLFRALIEEARCS